MALLKRIVAALTSLAVNLETFSASVAQANDLWRSQLHLDAPGDEPEALEDRRGKKK